MKNSVTKQTKILVVEDEGAIRKLCQRVFAGEGFGVDVAADGKVAKAMICEQRYDIYLADLKMPVLSGKELYEWLQEAYPSSASRVIFTTGSSIGKDTQSFLQRSGRQVLRKPFTPNELTAVVEEALKQIEK